MRKYYVSILVVLIFALFFSLAGCETVKGVGQDIQKAGEVMSGE